MTSHEDQEYEILLPALFTLFFLEDDTIRNFVLRSDVQKFGSFGDLIITLYKTDEEENYAFQVKHKEKQNCVLSPRCLESETKSDFAVLKYCEEFSGIEEREKYSFVTYTNAYFNSEEMNEVACFDINCCYNSPGKKYFYKPSSDNARIYNFCSNTKTKTSSLATKQTCESFFERFALYTFQQNWREVQEAVLENFQKMFRTSDRSAALEYIDYFKNWKLNEYTNVELNREELVIKILDLILTPHVVAPSNWNEDLALLERGFSKFDFVLTSDFSDEELATIVSPPEFESEEEVIGLAKNLKFLTKNENQFSDSKHEMEVKHKIGYYRKGKPIVVKVHEGNVDTIFATVSKFKTTGDSLHFIFAGNSQVVKEKLASFTVFESLYDLMKLDKEIYDGMVKEMKIFLLGEKYLYCDFFDKEEIATQITIKDIFRMLSSTFLLSIHKEVLPEPYIPRFLSKTLVKVESMDEFCNDLLVISLRIKWRVKELLEKRLGLPSEVTWRYLESPPSTPHILWNAFESFDNFEKVAKKYPSMNVHFFEAHDEQRLQWLASSGSLKPVKKCGVSKEIYVDEYTTLQECNNRINVITAPAGMGKSEILKKFKSFWPSKYFPVIVNLKEHSDFFDNVHEDDETLERFLFDTNDDLFWSEIKKNFAKRRKIMFFLDGLDELEHENIDVALDHVKRLSEMGFTLWLTSRPHLEELIENKLNVLCRNIREFSDKNEEDYIRERLKQSPNVDQLVSGIFKNTDTIVENRVILDVPMQLSMITEILKESLDISDNIFVLTKMFRNFCIGRYRHFLRKNDCEHRKLLTKILSDSLRHRFKQYQIAALKSYFTRQEFQVFNIDLDSSFLEEIETEGDFLGIILKINPDAVVFHHSTTATYFAALYLAENYSKYGEFLQATLFKKEQTHLRLLFDLILAENSPVHVAVLYKNVEALKNYKSDIHSVDKGGRSTLHLACSYGVTPVIIEDNLKNEHQSNDHFNKLRKKDDEFRKIIEFLMEHQVDLLSKDSVYQWNSLNFAEATRSFFLFDVILERNDPRFGMKVKILNLDIIKKNPLDVLKYCALSSWCHLFKGLFEITKPNLKDTMQILRVAAFCNNWEIVNFLMDYKVDFQTTTGCGTAILHQVCAMGHLELVVFFLSKGTDVNAATKYGRTPLYFAVKNGHEEVVKYLVDEAHANVNKKAWNGLGPLELAIKQGNVNMVRFFLEKTVDVDSTDGYGMKPLHLAAKQSNLEILVMVLERSKSVDVRTSNSRTSLHFTVENGNLAFCEYLLEKKARVNVSDETGKSCLFLAIIFGHWEIFELLLKHNANVDAFDNEGTNCVHWAAEHGRLKMLEVLANKSKRAIIDEKCMNGSTPLHWAAHKGHNAVVDFLVEKGADVDEDDDYSRTPLCWAASDGHVSTVELLLEKGATPRTISGMSALDFAKFKCKMNQD
ncbi:hypothetical protein Zmor_009430 [Zophobas morio]|uniref:NACHT domain-containing protein n=1 Tax=Zophobas morio TaxID=2755281 RepID=A0AA38IGN8_9CUCU|nr:hypothetical protein Zmor_009430 [Zophobas morio]